MKKIYLLAAFASAVLLSSIVTSQIILTFASGKHKKSNEATQDIAQLQALDQSASVDSGNNTIASGNNVGLLFNLNDRNNGLGQQ